MAFSIRDKNGTRLYAIDIGLGKVWATLSLTLLTLEKSPLSREAGSLIEICTLPMALNVLALPGVLGGSYGA